MNFVHRAEYAARRLSVCLLLVFAFVGQAYAQSWIELSPLGSPPNPVDTPKEIHYDAASNRLIVFFPGNVPGNQMSSNKVWVLTNANGLGGSPLWIELQPTGTPSFSNAYESVVYDSATNRLIVYGGCFANCAPPLANVFTLSNANGLGGTPNWTQSAVTNPQARASHSAVYDSSTNRMIAFGGHFAFFGTDQNDTRTLSNANGISMPSTWTTLTTTGMSPAIRSSHRATYDQANNRMTIFGGENLVSTCCPYVINSYNDAWVLSNANGVGTPNWTMLSPLGGPPAAREYHSAVWDSINNRMLVYGGGQFNYTTQSYTKFGDLWQLSNANGLGGTPVWTELSQGCVTPGPRFLHTAAFDAANQRMILLGGRDVNDVTSNRVWVLALNCPTITVAPATLSTGYAGVAYNQSFTASGGAGTYSFSLTGALPAGMTFANGVISGTATQTGSFPLTITATDQNGCTGCISYTLVVDCPAITLAPASLPTAGVGTNYSQSLSAAPNGQSYSFALTSGALPSGLSLNANTGWLSGVATALGNYTFTVTATGSGDCTGSRGYTLAVQDLTPPVITDVGVDKPALWPPNHKMVMVQVSYNVSDNHTPSVNVVCSLSVTSNEPVNGTGDGDTAPDWEVLDAHRVQLRAERSGSGNGRIYTITITCKDAAGNTATRTVSVSVPKNQS